MRSYLVPTGHRRRRLHLLGDDALLLLVGIVGAGGGHRLLLQLLGLGVLVQIFDRIRFEFLGTSIFKPSETIYARRIIL